MNHCDVIGNLFRLRTKCFEQSSEHADRIIISSPVLSHSKMQQLRDVEKNVRVMRLIIDLNYPEAEGLQTIIAYL